MIEAMKHYEAALMAAFPHGAAGKVFEHWNKARQAIEQAEKQEPFGYLWPTGRHPEFRFTQQLRDGVEGTPVYTTPLNPLDSIKSSKTLDAQPQQKPEYKMNDEKLLRLALEAIERGVRDGYWNKDTVDVSTAIQKRLFQPTPQPQREWVSLTDAEIEEFDYYARDLVMDIEKALKERNT